MKSLLKYLLLLLPLVSFADIPSTGDETVDELLYSLDGNLSTIQNMTSAYFSQLANDYQYAVQLNNIYHDNASSDGSSDFDRGAASGAEAILGAFSTAFNNVSSSQSAIVQSTSSARNKVVEIASLWSNMSDEDILRAISNNTFCVSSAVSNNTDVLSLDITTNMTACISNIVQISRLLSLVFPDSTNEVNQAVSALGGDVRQLCINFAEFWVTADFLITWMSDDEENFQMFYKNATERIRLPDSVCRTDLADMWNNLIERRRDILSVSNGMYSIDAQVENVLHDLDPDNFRLSNEGVIALENLAVNQRSYLCLAELVNRPVGTSSNYVDLAWITNYLGKVQSPYYTLWDYTFMYSEAKNYNPFGDQQFNTFTNFVGSALDGYDYVSVRRKYRNYITASSNYWERLETYLLNLNGLMPHEPFVDGEEEDELNRNLDSEILGRQIRYSTNAIFQAVENLSSVSNNLNAVLLKFKTFCNSFQLPQGSWDGLIRFTPQIQLGGITVDPIYLDESYFSAIKSAVRKVFECIWYAIFLLLSFRMVLLIIYLLGRTIAHVVLIISTLLA